MTAYDDQQQKIEELVREARLANLTRGEMLQASGSRGPAPGSPGLAVGRAGRAAAPNSACPPGATMRVAVAFTAAGTMTRCRVQGPEGRLRNNAVFDFLPVSRRTGQLVPSLATEATPNATATVSATIKLRSGVTFHDGSPLSS